MLTILRWALIVLIIAGIGLFVTRPQRVEADLYAGLEPDAERGAWVFRDVRRTCRDSSEGCWNIKEDC